ncbi:MAG TPA: hypothetical protein VEG60_06875 [Candidatus Binatia bacterium]|nr:hypothetical protein [Candidatus Binatia bacterium]
MEKIEEKIMPIETLGEHTLTSATVAETSDPLSEIVHDLKNCMSILLYWVETVKTVGSSPPPNDDSMDDLKKLALKMNSLIERLDSL